MPSRKRVVVAGLGDVGLLAAIRLAPHADVVGISVKPALVSGQELGVRLARPDDWARDYWISFDRYRRLDQVRTVQAELTGVDLATRTVFSRGADGTSIAEEFDALVISTGVSNGFWRQPTIESADEIGAGLRAAHDRLATAESVVVLGGGAAAVSSAVNLATTWPDKRIDLYFPGEKRPARLSLSHLEANSKPAGGAGRRRASGASCGGLEGLRRRRDHQWTGPLEHGPAASLRRGGALGDRAGTAQHQLAAARTTGRRWIRSRDAGTQGARS